MQKVTIKPNMLSGNVVVPPSKSYSHRALICGALAGGGTTIRNLGESADIKATQNGLEALGFSVKALEDCIFVEEKKETRLDVIDCNESGSTLRFLIPLALVLNERTTFLGHGRLMERPLDPYFKIFEEQGITYQLLGNQLTLKGKLSPGEFHLPGNVSSQFITGLLFALPLLEDESLIIMDSPLESRAYIDITLDVLKTFGIDVFREENKFIIPGNQQYRACDYTVEADYSQAAFFLVAGAIGGNIQCENLNEESLQGDREILEILKNTGANIEKVGKEIQINEGTLRPFQIDVSEIPDLFPILSVLAVFCEGESLLYNGARLRMKECDRLSAMATELKKLGAKVEEGKDYLKVTGAPALSGGTVDAHNDHRIAMALAISSERCQNEVIINGSDSVKKSMPDFWQRFEQLGGIFHECELGE